MLMFLTGKGKCLVNDDSMHEWSTSKVYILDTFVGLNILRTINQSISD